MPDDASRQPIPAGLEIHHEPRRPEFDPTLNIDVDVDRTGCAAEPAGDDRRLGHARLHERSDLPHGPVVAGGRRVRARQTSTPSAARSTSRRAGRAGSRSTSSARCVRSRRASDRSSTGTSSCGRQAGFTATWTGSRTTGSEATGSKPPKSRRDPAQPGDLRLGPARHADAYRDEGAPPDRTGTGRRLVPEAEGRGRQRPGGALRARDGARAR